MTWDRKGLAEIEKEMAAKVDVHLASTIRAYARKTNWASDLAIDCDTYHALCRLRPDLIPLATLSARKVFRTGEISETPNLRLIEDSGLRVGEQRRSFEWPQFKISGKIDAKVEVPRLGGTLRPLEHKACQSHIFRAIRRFRDEGIPLTISKYAWVRKYPGQLMLYCLMDGTEIGAFFFFDKGSGDYFWWLMPIDYGYTEMLIRRAERANENVEAGVIPKAERKEECNKCDFADTYCLVGKDYGEGIDFIDDDDDAVLIGRYYETAAAAEENGEIWEYLKDKYRGRDVVVGGKYHVISLPRQGRSGVAHVLRIDVLGENKFL
jgi:hypothetical protein